MKDITTIGFSEFKKTLTNNDGISYLNFIITLRPNYWIVWRDILMGYLGMFFSLYLSYKLHCYGIAPILTIIFGAIFIGYFFAYVQLFMHEAAHFNISPNHKVNDLLANIFICSWIGMPIKKYRYIHLQHHINIGTTKDTERSYFEVLSLKFILQCIFFIKLIKTFLVYDNTSKKDNSSKKFLFMSIILNCGIIFIIYQCLDFIAVISWLVGILCFFPLFLSVRQILEHRSETAEKNTDYSLLNHGETNRIFKGIFSSTLGGAGFNRHMIHHWEPRISYTNYNELENFLKNSELAQVLESRTTTYIKTFITLFKRSY